MVERTDRGPQSLDWLRSDRGLQRRLFHVVDVPPLRSVRPSQLGAKRGTALFAWPRASLGPALRRCRDAGHAHRLLSLLSANRCRYIIGAVLVRLFHRLWLVARPGLVHLLAADFRRDSGSCGTALACADTKGGHCP